MKQLYWILHGKTPIPATPMKCAEHLADASIDWLVAHTTFDGINISTVFLGIDSNISDGPPILFGTMVFGGHFNDYQKRYATWAEAEIGHSVIVNMVRPPIESEVVVAELRKPKGRLLRKMDGGE